MNIPDMKKTVLVIGAGGGVGKAVAKTLLERGYDVVGTVSKPGKITALQNELPACRAIIDLDLAKTDEAFEKLKALKQPLDGVVICAALSPVGALEVTPLDDLRTVIEVNCVAALAIYRATIASLRKNRGRLIFTSSMSGEISTPLQGAYVASKFALEGMVNVMRQEAAPWGVEIVLLQPGAIDTPMVAQARDAVHDQAALLQEPERALYGKLYAQMEYRISEVLRAKKMVSPATVADAAIEALEAAAPQTRYPIGADAEQFIAFAKTVTDRELDELILASYRSAPV
jgi:short-subunit dehydrogenase